jgi:starvation-inducible outer membrane lipoprotein
MKSRSLRILISCVALMLSACVVVPVEPDYAYGPPVIVEHHHGYGYRYDRR